MEHETYESNIADLGKGSEILKVPKDLDIRITALSYYFADVLHVWPTINIFKETFGPSKNKIIVIIVAKTMQIFLNFSTE